MLGSDSCLINISRGNIIVEKDLIHALKSKIIRGAVIDVFSREPLPGSSPLYKLDNVILTPHISGNINLFVDEIQEDFINKMSKEPEVELNL
jgi:phosphoglycerate dehydrogenase-like enzyme